MSYTIKETSELIEAVIALKDAAAAAKANDGKINFGDLALFVPALIKLPDAINDIEQIPRELGDLDEDEIQELAVKFGRLINQVDYQIAFFGLVTAASAINRIIKKEAA